MKFDELKLIAEKVEPPPPVIEGEVLDADEENEAFSLMGDPAYNVEERVVFKRCVQCAYLSITNFCPRCKNQPKMVAVDFVRVGKQMEDVGRVCSSFGTGTCIQRIEAKSKWCGDCVAFWDREFDQREGRLYLPLPAGMNLALAGPKKTKQELEAEFEAASMSEDEEDWEDELEEATEKVDKLCSFLLNVKFLLEFMADPDIKTVVEPQDRTEMRGYSRAITDLVRECGFDAEEYVSTNQPDNLFDERDRELLETIEEERNRGGQSLNRLMDKI